MNQVAQVYGRILANFRAEKGAREVGVPFDLKVSRKDAKSHRIPWRLGGSTSATGSNPAKGADHEPV